MDFQKFLFTCLTLEWAEKEASGGRKFNLTVHSSTWPPPPAWGWWWCWRWYWWWFSWTNQFAPGHLPNYTYMTIPLVKIPFIESIDYSYLCIKIFLLKYPAYGWWWCGPGRSLVWWHQWHQPQVVVKVPLSSAVAPPTSIVVAPTTQQCSVVKLNLRATCTCGQQGPCAQM